MEGCSVCACDDTEIPKTKWQFRVRWKGYDESEDTWNSWDSLKHVEALHIYLCKAGLQQYVPLSYKIPSDKKRNSKSVISESETEQPVETSVTRKKAKKQRRS
jgi:hypothetical protein